MDPTIEQMELVRVGAEYSNLRESPGYKRLIAALADQTNRLLHDLQNSKELSPMATARLVDRWRAHENVYQWIQQEIESRIEAAKSMVKELDGQGIANNFTFM